MRSILVAVAGVVMLSSRVEAEPRYELRVAKVKLAARVGGTGQGHDLSLWDRTRRRVLWKRRINHEYYTRTWSKDGRALAVGISPGLLNHWPLRAPVLVWRENYRVRLYQVPGEYTMGFAWSPDNRRLLIRSGGSGCSDMDLGGVYCLELRRWPRYKCVLISDVLVRRFEWKNRKTAIYWTVDDNTGKLKKPRLWHAP